MKKFKFKVGDLVRTKRSADKVYALTTTDMIYGLVVDFYEGGEMIRIKILSHKYYYFPPAGDMDDSYKVLAKHFTKITPKPKIKGLVGKKAVPKTLKGKK